VVLKRTRSISVVAFALYFAACSKGPSSFKEAESLEAEGKVEEAAQKFEFACAEAPRGPECQQSADRATTARLAAADKALREWQYKKAEELLIIALSTADKGAAKDIEARLVNDELSQGIRYEEALADPDKSRAYKAMEAIAKTSTPASEKAKEWIQRERPALLVDQVKAACRPKPTGSCSETFAAIVGLADKPPGFDEAKAAYDEEQKRTEKARFEARRFLAVFAQRGKKQKALEQCMTDKAAEIEDEAQRKSDCTGEIYEGKSAHERYDAEKTDDSLFRRRLHIIADPVLVASFEARRKEALETGEYKKVDDGEKK